MSPKTRLTLSITALTGAVALLLSVLSLQALVNARFQEVEEVARMSAETVRTYVLARIRERVAPAPGAGMEEAKAAWQQAVRDDAQLVGFLISSVASSSSLVEILVTDDRESVLAGSNPARIGRIFAPLPPLEEWTRQPPWRTLPQVLEPARDLELRVPLAAGGTSEAVLNIRVVVSTALVREAVVPQFRNLALLSVAVLAVAALLAGLLSSIAGKPLERVSRLIDFISEGRSPSELPPAPPDRELAALESKLALLGQQVRGAARDPGDLRGGVDGMLERLEDAVLLFDRERKLVMASKATERFLGISRWVLIGRPIEEVFPTDNPLGATVQTSANLHRGLRGLRLSWRPPGGPELHLLVSLEILEDFPERRPLGLIVTLRDAESRRQLESQIDSSLRREAFGRILQGVAHEIKNPLNSIYTHLQLLQLELSDASPDARQAIQVIGNEIKTLDRMVIALLDCTRPVELNLVATDLNSLASEIAGLLRPRAEAKGIGVIVEAAEGDAIVRADIAHLRRAVLNVVTNAVECMDKPGAVRLTVSRAPDALLLSVADQGPGIPEEIRDKIFNLYFTTKGQRGSGLGLAMAYRITQLHDAVLDFTSTPGQGSTFHFRFPAA